MPQPLPSQLGIEPELCEGDVVDVAVTVATPFELSEPPVGDPVGADSIRASKNHIRFVLRLGTGDSQGKLPPS